MSLLHLGEKQMFVPWVSLFLSQQNGMEQGILEATSQGQQVSLIRRDLQKFSQT